MKKYEKPRLIALSLQGNERLCGSCSDQGFGTVSDSPTLQLELGFIADLNGDGQITKSEFDQVQLFAEGEDCKTHYDRFCKFASTTGVRVAWS